MSGQIDIGQHEALPGIIGKALDLEQEIPASLKMADFGLFRYLKRLSVKIVFVWKISKPGDY